MAERGGPSPAPDEADPGPVLHRVWSDRPSGLTPEELNVGSGLRRARSDPASAHGAAADPSDVGPGGGGGGNLSGVGSLSGGGGNLSGGAPPGGCDPPSLPPHAKPNDPFPSIVTVNVGGRRFETTVSTLRADAESMLAAMFSENGFGLTRDDQGAYFIDRSGKWFEVILEYLRGAYYSVPASLNDRRALLCEAT